MNSEEALQKLQSIYDAAYIEKYAKAVPADMLNEEYKNFVDYTDALTDAWKFFGKRNMFDKRKDVGFEVTPKFADDWKQATEKQKSLIEMEIEGR